MVKGREMNGGKELLHGAGLVPSEVRLGTSEAGCLLAGCASCYPTKSNGALKELKTLI